MKININRIPPDSSTLREDIDSSCLDLDTDVIKFRGPIRAKADISRITNAVTVDLSLAASMYANCSRCLGEFKVDFKKNLKLNYMADRLNPVIDLDPDIKENIILSYPLKPLCSPDCKGLCRECGKNLNNGGCSCGTT